MWRENQKNPLSHIIGRGIKNQLDESTNLKDEEINNKNQYRGEMPEEKQSNISLTFQPIIEENLEQLGEFEFIPIQLKKDISSQDKFSLKKSQLNQIKNQVQKNKEPASENQVKQIEDMFDHDHNIYLQRQVSRNIAKDEVVQSQQNPNIQMPAQQKSIISIHEQDQLQINESDKDVFQRTISNFQFHAQLQMEIGAAKDYDVERPILYAQQSESQEDQNNNEIEEQICRIQPRRMKTIIDQLQQMPLSAHAEPSQHSFKAESQKQQIIFDTDVIISQMPENTQENIVQPETIGPQKLVHSQQNKLRQEKDTQKILLKANKSLFWLILKITFIFMLIGAISALLAMNSCMFFNVGQCTSQNKSVLPPLIVNRNFQENQCFVVNYSKITSTTVEANTSLTRTNETLYYCILGITKNGDLNLVGYYKHISQQDLSVSPPKVNYYDTSVMLESPLIYPSNTSQSFANGSSFNINNLNANITINSSMEQQIIDHLVMFQFTISRNGTLLNLIFNTQNEKATIGQLPKLIKLFFPKIDLSLYLPSARLLQFQDDDYVDRFIQSNFTTNITDNTSNTQIGYEYSNNNGGAHLTNSLTQGPSLNDPIFASHATTSQSSFDNDGQLYQGGMQGQSTITTPQIPPSSTHQVFNMPMEINLEQNVSMSLVATMNNLTQQKIAQFYAFFYIYSVQTNKTLNFTEDELSAYLIDQGGNSSQSRLLTQSPNSVFLKDHKFMLLQTSALGMSLVVEGRVYVKFDLTQLSKYKYQPQFKTGAIIMFSLGPFHTNYPIFAYNRKFDP